MGFQNYELSVGVRIAAVRQARSAMSQQDLADAIGVNRMTVNRWEAGMRVPVAKLAEVADALRVSPDTLRRPVSEIGHVLTLLVQSGAILEAPPRPLGTDAPGCFFLVARFEVLAHLSARVVVVCAPMIGQHQVRRALSVLGDIDLVHHVLFVSEEPHDRSASWEVRKAAAFPELHLMRSAELERHFFSLTALAQGALALADNLPQPTLEPRLAMSGEDAEPRPVQAALWCWVSEMEHPSHLALIGAPGSGKTVAVRRFAAALASAFVAAPDQRLCPVYVALWSLLDATDLRARLAHEIQVQLGLSSRTPIERALEGGRLLLILDGVDELVGRNPARLYAVERAIEQILRLPGRVLLTARTPMFLIGASERRVSGTGQTRLPLGLATLLPLERSHVVAHLARLPDGGRAMLELIRQHGLMDLANSPYVLDILFEGAPLYVRPFLDGRPVLCNLLNRRYQAWLYDDAPHFQRSSDDLGRLLGELASTLRRLGRARGFRDDLDPETREMLFPTPMSAFPPPPRQSRFLVVEADSFSFVHRRMEEFFFATWVADQIRHRRADGILCHWIDRHDLTLLSGLLGERAQVEALADWATDGLAPQELREQATYLLAFSGEPERAAAVLRSLRERSREGEPSETLAFSLAALGATDVLDELIRSALHAVRQPARGSARLLLLSLGLHEALLPPTVQAPVRQTLLALDIDELHHELIALVQDPQASVTARAAAVTALGYLGAAGAAEVIRELLDNLALHHLSRRSPTVLRLTMAARLALELVGAGRFPQRTAPAPTPESRGVASCSNVSVGDVTCNTGSART